MVCYLLCVPPTETETEKGPRITVILTDELREELEATAKRDDRSAGAVVRLALREYFDKGGAK